MLEYVRSMEGLGVSIDEARAWLMQPLMLQWHGMKDCNTDSPLASLQTLANWRFLTLTKKPQRVIPRSSAKRISSGIAQSLNVLA